MLHAKLVVGLRAPKLLPKWLGSTGDRAFLQLSQGEALGLGLEQGLVWGWG